MRRCENSNDGRENAAMAGEIREGEQVGPTILEKQLPGDLGQELRDMCPHELPLAAPEHPLGLVVREGHHPFATERDDRLRRVTEQRAPAVFSACSSRSCVRFVRIIAPIRADSSAALCSFVKEVVGAGSETLDQISSLLMRCEH